MSTTRIPGSLLEELRDHLAQRRIERGIGCLERHRQLLETLTPRSPRAGRLVGHVAQWVDVGYADLGLARKLVGRFPADSWSDLALGDYVYLRLAQGLVAMLEERLDAAVGHFEFVLSLEAQVPDRGVVAISSFWIGRCHRKQGAYDEALEYTRRARDEATASGYSAMAAVMRLLESWLAFQKGATVQAWRILDEVEEVLSATDDHMSMGNLYSARGRMTRRDGRYERSLEYFDRAIREYRKRNPVHPHIARALANLAAVKRLIAVQVARRIDESAARGEAAGGQRLRFERLRLEASSHLDEAERIFVPGRHHHGLGNVMLVRGLLAMDAGDLSGAEAEADRAYRAAQAVGDRLVLARARILHCMVENARFDEQIEEFDDPSRHAQRAFDCGLEAVELARQTENRRLLARACVWVGLTLSNAFFNDLEAARGYCERASGLLRHGGADHSWRDYQTLRRRIIGAGKIDDRLRQWSQGDIGNRTLLELEEEFAGIVIPKIWAQENHRVSRVARRLSVSPKKVRRILERQRLRPPSGAPKGRYTPGHVADTAGANPAGAPHADG